MDGNIQKQVFNTWYNLLKQDLLESKYMNKLIKFINEEYKSGKKIFPNKRNIFKAFTDTDYNKLKVVILGDNPYANDKDIGIAFANEEKHGVYISEPLSKIEQCITNNVKDGLHFMDYDLNNWSKQGVLCINTSLSSIRGQEGSHAFYWSYFMKYLLKSLSEVNTGIIYCLWGNQAQSFKQYINTKNNYILEFTNPSDAVKKGIDWNCTHFNDINKIIEKNNGKSECINW
tara:strand:+ start:4563 stop:5252 length:690 start_codon:yes stop_codon:yes gene_type:complete